MKILNLTLAISIQFLIIYKRIECLPIQMNVENLILANQLKYIVNQEENVLEMMKNLVEILYAKTSLDYYNKYDYDYDGYYDEDDYDGYYDGDDEDMSFIYDHDSGEDSDSKNIF